MYQSVFSPTCTLLIVWPVFHAVGVMIDFSVNIGEGLRDAGTEAVVRRAREVRDLSLYGVAVVGRSVHVGRLPGEIRRYDGSPH